MQGRDLLWTAAFEGNVASLSHLLDLYGESALHSEYKVGPEGTCLFLGAPSPRHAMSAAEVLLRSQWGATLATIAASRGHLPALKLLVARGADLEAADVLVRCKAYA
jgi:ankyrin repeat protein